MKTSFDEIKRMSFRALDAAGAPAGVDEESAYTTAWLEASGLPGLRLLGDALDNSERPQRRGDVKPELRDCAAYAEAGGASAVFAGPGLVDMMAFLLSSYGDDALLTVAGLTDAPFLFGLIGQQQDRGVEMCISPSEPGSAPVEIKFGPGRGTGMPDWDALRARRQQSLSDGINADDAAFQRIYTYSRAILVPETEESRLSGAGAGLTDND